MFRRRGGWARWVMWKTRGDFREVEGTWRGHGKQQEETERTSETAGGMKER